MENAGKEDMPEDAERQGLGTPATRAAMIEKLLSAGFVERKGKSLVPTKDGINLAVILPDMLKSPLLTAEWESRLTEIAKGSDDPQSFMQGIEDMTRELVKQYSHITEDGTLPMLATVSPSLLQRRHSRNLANRRQTFSKEKRHEPPVHSVPYTVFNFLPRCPSLRPATLARLL